jgi:phosphate-selective porin OprO and OprP
MLIKKWAIGGVALGALLAATGAKAATDVDARLRVLEAEIAKLRKEAHEAKAQAAKATNVANAAHGKVDPHAPPPPPPVFVSFKNGIFVETEDKAYSFKVGGRILVDGGGNSQPLNGLSSQVLPRQIRLEVEGKFAKIWFYKLQYDFAGTGQVTGNNQVLGGMRDVFFGIQHPALTLPFAKDPMFIMVGSQFEPFSLESTSSSKFRPLIERAMAVEGIAPNRHIGISMGAYGDNWTGRIGVFSTSMEDASYSPGQNTPSTWGVPKGAGWVSTGGAQFVDVSGRMTYAPIRDEHNLLHFGVSGRYHSPNDATGANDDRVLRLGNRLRSEATILGQGPLGTPDLSCGSYANGGLFAGVPFSSVAGHCTKYVTSYGFELAGAYGPFDMQAEYIATDYQRDQNKILQARASGVFAPGGSSAHFGGYYLYGQYWLTGEERAQAYDTKDKSGANFFEPKIKNPLSAGGYGAISLIGRYSAINLNSGPYSGSGLSNMLAATNPTGAVPGNATYLAIANAGIAGGRQENVTAGLNWHPDKGVQIQFNWTHVLHLSAPLNDYNIVGAPFPTRQGAYMNGAHPDIFEARAKIYW